MLRTFRLFICIFGSFVTSAAFGLILSSPYSTNWGCEYLGWNTKLSEKVAFWLQLKLGEQIPEVKWNQLLKDIDITTGCPSCEFFTAVERVVISIDSSTIGDLTARKLVRTIQEFSNTYGADLVQPRIVGFLVWEHAALFSSDPRAQSGAYDRFRLDIIESQALADKTKRLGESQSDINDSGSYSRSKMFGPGGVAVQFVHKFYTPGKF